MASLLLGLARGDIFVDTVPVVQVASISPDQEVTMAMLATPNSSCCPNQQMHHEMMVSAEATS